MYICIWCVLHCVDLENGNYDYDLCIQWQFDIGYRIKSKPFIRNILSYNNLSFINYIYLYAPLLSVYKENIKWYIVLN